MTAASRSLAPGDVASMVGKGLVAGAIGTALMTVSSTVEAKLTKRDASTAPADAALKVLRMRPEDDAAKARFSNLVHWGYGTSWGAARGLLGGLGLPAPVALAAHFGTVWGSGLVMLPKLEVAEPVSTWGGKAVATDAFHHAVYATGTTLAFALLQRTSKRA